MDIIERLRTRATGCKPQPDPWRVLPIADDEDLFAEAADEIESLRARISLMKLAA